MDPPFAASDGDARAGQLRSQPGEVGLLGGRSVEEGRRPVAVGPLDADLRAEPFQDAAEEPVVAGSGDRGLGHHGHATLVVGHELDRRDRRVQVDRKLVGAVVERALLGRADRSAYSPASQMEASASRRSPGGVRGMSPRFCACPPTFASSRSRTVVVTAPTIPRR